MEDYGYTYFQERAQFVTTMSSGRKCSMNFIPMKVINSDFCPFFAANQFQNNEKTSLKTDTEFASPWTKDPSGENVSQSLHYKSWKMCFYSQKTNNIYNKRWRCWDYTWYFLPKSWSKSINTEMVSKGFNFIASADQFPKKALNSFKNFCRSNWIWKGNGRLQFWNYPTPQRSKFLKGGYSCFRR